VTWAEVAVVAGAPHQGTYTYVLPSEMPVRPGSAVLVGFGARRVTGVVWSLTNTTPELDAKPVLRLLSAQPVVTPLQMRLAEWLAERYLCGLGEAIGLMVPAGVREEGHSAYQLGDAALLPSGSGPRDQIVIEALRDLGAAQVEQIRIWLSARRHRWPPEPVLSRLVRSGAAVRIERWRGPTAQVRTERWLRLDVDATALEMLADSGRLHESTRDAISRLHELATSAGEPTAWPAAALVEMLGAGVVDRLVANGALARETRDDVERPVLSPPQPPPLALTPSQLDAASRVMAAMDYPVPGVFLLHGVTGSGKTEVYFRAIDEVISRGLQAILLVPEISMTPQALGRLRARYGDAVAVIHSKLGSGERHAEWLRVRSGEASIVVGARSALLAPVFALGLIVVDEEHEPSYKQEAGVRYHARDAAIELGRLAGVPVVLGSATPDVVTYQRAQSGAYHLLTLPERYLPPASAARGDTFEFDAGLPEAHVIDLRTELREGNASIFSTFLRSAVDDALARGEQAILFLNRRGASTFVMCRDCGLVMMCKRCDSSLVYHSAGEDLVCHLCNRHTPTPKSCPGCGGLRIRYFGVGTQRVETEARVAFPNARVLRYDRDTVRTRNAHEAMYAAFAGHEADILIGTQMIAKGFDYPLVTVVGIISADQTLHLPDFRAPERTFQLLTQVAGRAGRRDRPGLAVIQTYSPDHYAVQAASRHDYEAFATEELGYRQRLRTPPYYRIARLFGTDWSERRVAQQGETLAEALRLEVEQQGYPDVEVLGPSPAFRRRVKGIYSWQLIVRASDPWLHRLLSSVKLPARWQIDVDPQSMI
jgi:primosomal protein N' (replication factor Y) (superfamily II helicase)